NHSRTVRTARWSSTASDRGPGHGPLFWRTRGTISPGGVLRLKPEPEQDGVIYRMAANRLTLTCEVRGTVGPPYTAFGWRTARHLKLKIPTGAKKRQEAVTPAASTSVGKRQGCVEFAPPRRITRTSRSLSALGTVRARRGRDRRRDLVGPRRGRFE